MTEWAGVGGEREGSTKGDSRLLVLNNGYVVVPSPKSGSTEERAGPELNDTKLGSEHNECE